MTEISRSHVSTGPVGLTNSTARFGGVAKAFHWLVAALILTMIPLGVVAQYWPYDTSEALATKATLFSIHKTLGLVTFAVALARILWALIQPRPVLLPNESRWQSFAAEAVHWSLYAALVLVPLTGWIHHAASTGFAPICWPFGQTLPFVPQSQPVADAFGGLHFAFVIVLVVSLALHIGGALKHHVVEKDATLKRMLPGTCDLPEELPSQETHRAPMLAAMVLWLAALGAGLAYGTKAEDGAATATLAAVQSGWTVQSGTLGITVQQLGQPVTGDFADWTAAIEFSEQAANGQHGQVEVTIAIPSLSLGGVTEQALAADFLNASEFATATYSGAILAEDGAYVVDGTLELVGASVPLRLPFLLEIEGDTATASGDTNLDRRDFEIGTDYPDESSVGFGVTIAFELTATRGEAE